MTAIRRISIKAAHSKVRKYVAEVATGEDYSTSLAISNFHYYSFNQTCGYL